MATFPALIVLAAAAPQLASANWDAWWTYDGISGPSYWGVINPAWTLCNKGRFQSPININPREGRPAGLIALYFYNSVHNFDLNFDFCVEVRATSHDRMHCRKVAFDPTLDPVRVDKVPVSGVLYNTGQSLVFRADSDRLSRMPVNMTGGPFSYRQAWNGQKRISRKTSVRTRRQKSPHRSPPLH